MVTDSVDTGTAAMIRSWTWRRGIGAGRIGGLVSEDYEALERLLNRPPKKEEKVLFERTWEDNPGSLEDG